MPDDLVIKTIFKAIDRITGPVKRMSSGVSKFSSRAARSLGKINRVTSKIGRGISRGVTKALKAGAVAAVALGVAIKKVVELGAGFEKNLVIAATKFPGEIRKGSAEYKILEDAARKAGATTEFTANESALALKQLGAAGIETVDKAAAILPKVIDFATSAEVEVGQAAEMAMKVLGALGKEATVGNLEQVMDVMKNASDSAAQSLEDVYEQMLESGPVAKMFNQDVEVLGATVIGMARAGIVAQKSGTAYRNMMLRLADPVGKARVALKKLGIEVADSAGNMRNPIAIVRDFSKALDGMGTQKRAQMISRVFGMRPLAGFNALLQMGSEKLAGFALAGRQAAGSVSRSAEAIRDTTSGSLASLSASVESVIISLFKLDDRGIKGVVDAVTEWVRANEKLIIQNIGDKIKWIAENWDRIIKGFKTVAAIVGTLWLLSKAIGAVSAALTIVNLVMAANPVVLIVMAIIAVIALLAGLVVYYWDDIVDVWKKAAVIAEDVIGSVVETFSSIGAFFSDLWDIIKAIFWAGVNALAGPGAPFEYLLMAILSIRDAFGQMGEFIGVIWDNIKDSIMSNVGQIWGQVKWVVNKLMWIYSLIGKGLKYISGEVTEGAEGARESAALDKAELGYGGRGMNITPAGRATSITERRETTKTSKGLLTIRDETGRSEYSGDDPFDLGMSFEPTGTF